MSDPHKQSHAEGAENAGDCFVRRASLHDLPAVSAISDAAHPAARWKPEVYRTFCKPESQGAGTVAKILLVACVSQRQNIAGFAAFQAILATGECGLENMGVAEELRRRGIGRRLLTAGLLWCRGWRAGLESASEPDDNLWLEVRPSNRAAVDFYRKAGFIEAGRRPGYYSHPVEEALLMRKNIHLLA